MAPHPALGSEPFCAPCWVCDDAAYEGDMSEFTNDDPGCADAPGDACRSPGVTWDDWQADLVAAGQAPGGYCPIAPH